MTWLERLLLYAAALAVGLAVVMVERWLGLEAALIMVAIATFVVVAATTELDREPPSAEKPAAGGAGSSSGGVRLMGDRRHSKAARAGTEHE